MNAQSTPVKKRNLKIRSTDLFPEVTPIRNCTMLCSEFLNASTSLITSPKENHVLTPLSKSQRKRVNKRKKKGENGKLNKKLFSSNSNQVNNLSTVKLNKSSNKDSGNYSNEFIANFSSEITDLFDDTFRENSMSVHTEEWLLKNEFSKSPYNSDSKKLNRHSIFKSECSKFKVEKLSQNFLKEEIKSDTVEKLSEILSVSDVMNWNDESLMPKTHSMNLTDQIKKKLLENAKNKEVVISQTSGWTQLNSSMVLKADKCVHYQEIGPFYGLPIKVQQLYAEHKGIKELYSWQQECLSLNAVKNHQNLVYALPTSGGKTLVAELLILREILCYKRNVLFILPYVSIVQEKIKDFSHFALELGFLVEEYAAGKGVIPPKKRRRKNSLVIATIEKALIIVNSLIEVKRLHEFGLIVVDELHMLSEEGRGAILETILTQILYKKENIQIIGMTATIGNLEEVAKFLEAESYVGNFRPVNLREYIKCDNKIYSIEWTSENLVSEVRILPRSSPVDPDDIGKLVQEIIPQESVLIFCPARKNCENVALLLSKLLSRDLLKNKHEEKMSLYRALMSESNNQICPVLKKTLPFGVAYHHSGLTAGERKLLEESFRDGTLSVICCTSTLAVGVNLPAKRVILRSPYVGLDFISLSKYKQMVGRAGRSGFGSEGESFLICQTADLEKVRKLLQSQMDETTSKLDVEACKDLVLSSIGLETATTRRTLRELLTRSLLHVQTKKLKIDTKKMTDTCISSLHKQGALVIKNKELEIAEENSSSKLDLNVTTNKKSLRISNDSQLMISRLGRAAMKGGLSLERAHDLYSDLIKAQSNLVLLSNLHLLYLISPPDMIVQIKPNFSIYFNAYMQLSSNELHTAKIIGITEYVMSKLAMGILPKSIEDAVVNRFYIALMLNELWKQRTVWDVATQFQLPRGLVQTLMTSASTFANCLLRFCEELQEFWCFKSMFTDFAPRVAYCCSAELLPLMDLPAVKRGRAKQLYEAGFKTLNILAVTKPGDLVRSVDHLSMKVASQIVAAAKLLLMEKVENLKEEAEDVLEGLAEQSAPKEM